jgi:hypothetical protein
MRKLAFAIKNSSTIILPQWFATLQELALAERVMPRDVRTRWNSTYDMLDFAYDYKDALNKITAVREMKLRNYEIEPEEWEMVRQLRELLKVVPIFPYSDPSNSRNTDLQGRDALFLS